MTTKMVVIIDHSYMFSEKFAVDTKAKQMAVAPENFPMPPLWKLELLVLASTSTLISLIFHPNNSLLVYVTEKLTVKIWVKIRLVHQEMLYKQQKPHVRNIRIKSPVSHPLVLPRVPPTIVVLSCYNSSVPQILWSIEPTQLGVLKAIMRATHSEGDSFCYTDLD